MKIFIEDYNGNDLCSFEVPALEVLYDIYEKDTMWLHLLKYNYYEEEANIQR